MKIHIQVMVKGQQIDDIIEIDDYKVEELSEEDLEASIEVVIRNWADEHISISWEAEDRKEQG